MVGVVITAEGSQAHWDFALCNFKPDRLFVHGDPALIDSSFLCNGKGIEGPHELPADHALVVLAPGNGEHVRGLKSLANFRHPENAIYWFGSDAKHLTPDVFALRAPDHLVYIPTDTIDQMYAPAAWAVVAWDRRCKEA